MSGYSEHYKEQQRAAWLRRWEPEDGWPESYDEQHKWLSARARSAEAALREVRQALGVLERFREGGYDSD